MRNYEKMPKIDNFWRDFYPIFLVIALSTHNLSNELNLLKWNWKHWLGWPETWEVIGN